MNDSPITRAVSNLIEQNDADEYLAVLKDGATFWHNDDKETVRAADMVGNVQALHGLADDIGCAIVENFEFPETLIVRAKISGTAKNSMFRFAADVCLFIRIENGLIAHVDEYVDPGMAKIIGQ